MKAAFLANVNTIVIFVTWVFPFTSWTTDRHQHKPCSHNAIRNTGNSVEKFYADLGAFLCHTQLSHKGYCHLSTRSPSQIGCTSPLLTCTRVSHKRFTIPFPKGHDHASHPETEVAEGGIVTSLEPDTTFFHVRYLTFRDIGVVFGDSKLILMFNFNILTYRQVTG